MSDETTLLPCPFCGGEARHYASGPIDHHIECVECYADTHRDTEAEAIAAWNTRAELGSGTCENAESRWFALFGTPERTAQTMALMCECSPECSFCLLKGRAENICGNGDYDALLEWLRGDAE